jgi:hypothetical protein
MKERNGRSGRYHPQKLSPFNQLVARGVVVQPGWMLSMLLMPL